MLLGQIVLAKYRQLVGLFQKRPKSINTVLLQQSWMDLSVPKAAVAEAASSPRKAVISMGAARVSD